MNNLMLTVLSLSLAGSIIIAFLFLCKPLYKERLSKKWQYYVWLIVIARLLVPFSFEVNFVGNLFNEIRQANSFGFSRNEQSDVVVGGDGAIIVGSGNEGQVFTPDVPSTQDITPDLQPFLTCTTPTIFRKVCRLTPTRRLKSISFISLIFSYLIISPANFFLIY